MNHEYKMRKQEIDRSKLKMTLQCGNKSLTVEGQPQELISAFSDPQAQAQALSFLYSDRRSLH